MQDEILHFNETLISETVNDKTDYIGKVITVSDIGYGNLLMTASDRLSAFDRHICNISSK